MLIHFLAKSSMGRWIPLSSHIVLALPNTMTGNRGKTSHAQQGCKQDYTVGIFFLPLNSVHYTSEITSVSLNEPKFCVSDLSYMYTSVGKK